LERYRRQFRRHQCDVTVTLSAASGQTITVNYSTADGTALAGSDYTASSGTLTFAPGQTSKTVTVTVLGDTVVEGTESFTLNLSGATNATLPAPKAPAPSSMTNTG